MQLFRRRFVALFFVEALVLPFMFVILISFIQLLFLFASWFHFYNYLSEKLVLYINSYL